MRYFFAILSLFLIACTTDKPNPLDQALSSQHPAIAQVMQDIDNYEVQIIYTRIDTTASGASLLSEFTFQLESTNYFYPASTVKFPVAVLALERLDQLKQLSLSSPYVVEGDTLVHSIEDDVRQIFAVSDNDAYNRLYEFLGRDYVNAQLQNKGLQPVRISHRLATENAAERKRSSLLFKPNKLDTLFQPIPTITNTIDSEIRKLSIQKLLKGKGYMRNDSLIDEPMDFSKKNYFPLQTQHELLKRLFFEDMYPPNQQFQLSETSKNFLLKAMHTVPRHAGYNETEYYDSYGKFFIYGDSKEPMPKELKIFNKVGYAYGTLTDTAYIVDEVNNIHFLLSATILVNKNGIFNDDVYEYETVGIPFLAQLGREVYRYEFARKKKN
jgi:hypothetical protein